MNTDELTDHRHCIIAPEAQGWTPLSNRLRDAGERAVYGELVAAVAVAAVLAAAWFFALPSIR